MDMTEQECLPTLLFSRRKMRAAQHEISLKPLELCEDSMPLKDFGVKNTFIDDSLPCSPSLLPFYQERQVQSCPSVRVGCLKHCLEDIVSVSTEKPKATPRARQGAVAFPTPTGEDVAHQLLWPATPCYDEHVAGPMVSYESIPAASVMAPMQYQCMAWGDHYASPAPAFCNEVIGEPMASSRKTVVCLSDVLCYEPKGSAKGYLAESAPLPTPVVSAHYKPVAVPIAPPPLSRAPGSAELPSIGSAAHEQGRCRPCAFFHTKGCEIGPTCSFCHLCGVDERKRRRKETTEQRQVAREARKAVVAARG
mmetsp:Transcript_3020/g.7242  ORF Transcript_3020/g.7242 Transcript_3020/m.7242 type:complete len:308 (-) Transcript_3020:452-1375(-)